MERKCKMPPSNIEQYETDYENCMEYYDDSEYCNEEISNGGFSNANLIIYIAVIGYVLYILIKKSLNKK
jgi:hypothetical protein